MSDRPSRSDVLASISRLQDKARILAERALKSPYIDYQEYDDVSSICDRILEITSYLHDRLVKE